MYVKEIRGGDREKGNKTIRFIVGELALCTESEFDDQRAMRLNLMLNICTRQEISLKTMTIQKHLIWTYITCVIYLSRAFLCGELRKVRHFFTVVPKLVYCGPQFFTVAPKLEYCGLQTCLLWVPNMLRKIYC